MTLPNRVRVIDGLFALYKQWLGPALHAAGPMQGGCPYQPTCSEYAALACAQHGFVRGGILALWRVLRCNPFSRGGWDPVPLNNSGSGAQVP